MPKPEDDSWGGDWEQIGADIIELSDDIYSMWPAHKSIVDAVLNSPELSAEECYGELLKMQASIHDQIEAAREVVEPWQPLNTNNFFNALADNDIRPYDYEYEHDEKTRFGRLGRRAISFTVNYVSLFEQPSDQFAVEHKDSN